MSRPRQEGETFEQYRASLAGEGRSPKGVLTLGDGFNRERHRKMLAQAKKELAAARARGYSDEQILEALMTGTDEQKVYAQYIDFFILKVG